MCRLCALKCSLFRFCFLYYLPLLVSKVLSLSLLRSLLLVLPSTPCLQSALSFAFASCTTFHSLSPKCSLFRFCDLCFLYYLPLLVSKVLSLSLLRSLLLVLPSTPCLQSALSFAFAISASCTTFHSLSPKCSLFRFCDLCFLYYLPLLVSKVLSLSLLRSLLLVLPSTPCLQSIVL